MTKHTPDPVSEFLKADYGDYPVLKWKENYIAKIGDKFYTHPKEWQDLTVEQIWDVYMKAPIDIDCHINDLHKFARAILKAAKEKQNDSH